MEISKYLYIGAGAIVGICTCLVNELVVPPVRIVGSLLYGKSGKAEIEAAEPDPEVEPEPADQKGEVSHEGEVSQEGEVASFPLSAEDTTSSAETVALVNGDKEVEKLSPNETEEADELKSLKSEEPTAESGGQAEDVGNVDVGSVSSGGGSGQGSPTHKAKKKKNKKKKSKAT